VRGNRGQFLRWPKNLTAPNRTESGGATIENAPFEESDLYDNRDREITRLWKTRTTT
jgi:hypothetical protein